MSVLDRRIVLVTGKGGVGKTTVAAALALEAASQGQRVLLAETAGSRRVPAIFGKTSEGYAVQKMQPNLYTMSITGREAIEDYVIQQVKIRALYKMVFRNRVMGPFMDGIPGLHDLVQLGKVMDLERERSFGKPVWDLLVVDAPATGHGLTMLDAPRSMMELTRAGPFHENARAVHEVIADPTKTGLVLVTLPEEMPVNETLDLYGRLGPYAPQVRLAVLNEVQPAPFPEVQEWPSLRPYLQDVPGLGEAVHLTDQAVAREERTQRARMRLSEGLPCPLAELPLLARRDLRPAQLDSLGDLLR